MITIDSVLCPIDFSDQSREALNWASAIAQLRGSQLIVLTVVDPHLPQAARLDAEPLLKDFVEATLRTSVKPGSRLRLQVQVGDASKAILDVADREASDLIVMGTHGLGGVRKLLLGSTTEQVLRRTQMPILAVSTGTAPELGANQLLGAHLRRLLMATDFGEGSSAAMQWAIELARELAVSVIFLHVVKPVAVPEQWRELVEGVDEENVVSAQCKLERLSASIGKKSKELVVLLGQPANIIESFAMEHDVGLVIMGLTNELESNRRGPGSIAYRVLRNTHLPVLVVPPLPKSAL